MAEKTGTGATDTAAADAGTAAGASETGAATGAATTGATTAGIGTGTMVAIGVGAAATVGGLAYIASSSDDNGGGSSNNGASDSFTGRFVARNLSVLHTIIMTLSQNGSSVSGSNEMETYDGFIYRHSVSGQVSGNSADITLYDGHYFNPDGEEIPSEVGNDYGSATLMSGGSILRIELSELTADLYRE